LLGGVFAFFGETQNAKQTAQKVPAWANESLPKRPYAQRQKLPTLI
jgi:hypothetical protein